MLERKIAQILAVFRLKGALTLHINELVRSEYRTHASEMKGVAP